MIYEAMFAFVWAPRRRLLLPFASQILSLAQGMRESEVMLFDRSPPLRPRRISPNPTIHAVCSRNEQCGTELPHFVSLSLSKAKFTRCRTGRHALLLARRDRGLSDYQEPRSWVRSMRIEHPDDLFSRTNCRLASTLRRANVDRIVSFYSVNHVLQSRDRASADNAIAQ